MLHPGDSTYEAEHRLKEASRVLVERQAGRDLPQSWPRVVLNLRESYYRRLAEVGGRACDLGLELGCALEARAVTNGRAAAS